MHTSEIETLCVSKEIEILLEASHKVQRFTGDDLPQGIVKDTVGTHTLRCMSTAEVLPINYQERQTIKKMLLLHDLPEVIAVLSSGKTADVTSPQKEAMPEYDEKIAHCEYEVAEAIFTPLEFNLYRQFEESGNYLKGKHFDSKYLTVWGVYSQLIDKTDANLTLHLSVSRWSLTSQYNPDHIKSDRSLSYVFRQQQKFAPRLSGDPLNFYTSSVESIKDLWREVRKRGVSIPPDLISYLD